MANKPHILVTNDDSIHSGFLQALVDGLKTAFTLTVAAPKHEQSWIGRAVSRNREVSVESYEGFPGTTAYSIDGTPSDCVNIALGHLLDKKPDAICSGINVGYNTTLPFILSSGTISGAMEGAFWKIPSLAFSHHIASSADYIKMSQTHATPEGDMVDSLKNAALLAVRFTEKALKQDMSEPIVHNINFPTNTTLNTPVEMTEPAPFDMGTIFVPQNKAADGKRFFRFKYSEKKPDSEGPYDYLCLQNKKISHTLLNISKIGKIPNA